MAYYDNINYPLLNSIPPGAKNILELGCASGVLGAAYKERNPAAKWTGVEIHHGSIREAIPRLDKVVYMDLNSPTAENLDTGPYDCIVMGDVLEHLIDPEKCLRFVNQISTSGATLHICVPNMSHFSVLYRMLLGDITYDPNGLLDKTHLRFLSYSSAYKMILDAGWLPSLEGMIYGTPADESEQSFFGGLVQAASAMKIPKETAERNLVTFQIVINAIKSEKPKTREKANLSVIIPMNNHRQFDLNIIRSAGLHEIGAEIIPIKDATSAADALEKGKNYIKNDWILFCHQDVYIPKDSGHLIAEIINSIPNEKKNNTLIGFAGTEETRNAGLVIDRTGRFDFPGSMNASSIDEFALLFTRDSIHKIDHSFGWHAWATDMCLAAKMCGVPAQIKRIPLFHNSVTPNGPTDEFNHSIGLLKQKYKGFGTLNALTGRFEL